MSSIKGVKKQIDYSKLEKELSDAINKLRKSLGKTSKDVLGFYSATWLIEPVNRIKPAQNDKPFVEMQYIERKSKAIDIRNKEEIIQYLKGLIESYSHRITGMNDDYREIVRRYLTVLLKRVKDFSFPELTDKRLSYAVSIEGVGVGIQLSHLAGCQDSYEEVLETVLFVNCSYISAKQYAATYRVAERTVRRWITNKRIHHVLRDRDLWYISEMQQRPSKALYTASYGWYSLSSVVTCKHKELVNCCGMNIEREYGQKLFECMLFYADDTQQTMYLSDEQRIELETLVEKFADRVKVEENYPCVC